MTKQRMAVVDQDNNVTNVIVYDTEASWTPPEGTRLIQDGIFGRGVASPGGTWDGSKFIPSIIAPLVDVDVKAIKDALPLWDVLPLSTAQKLAVVKAALRIIVKNQ